MDGAVRGLKEELNIDVKPEQMTKLRYAESNDPEVSFIDKLIRCLTDRLYYTHMSTKKRALKILSITKRTK